VKGFAWGGSTGIVAVMLRGTGWVVGFVCALGVGGVACESDKASGDSQSATASAAEAKGAAAADQPAAAQSAAAGTSAGDCPAGRWHYDYSDQALEVMMKNVADAKVVKEEGDFICEISKGDEGTIFCDTGETPVHNVVETKQAGVPMTVSVKLDGKGTTRFKRLDAKRLQVSGSDTKDLKLEASVSLAGKQMPFPADKMVSIFGDEDAILSYKCEGGKLLLKPEIEGTETTWQELTAVK